MGRVDLLSCIESLLAGDSGFSTLKGVVVDGKVELNDYFWCDRSFVIFKVIINEKPFYLKIALKHTDKVEQFLDTVEALRNITADFIVDISKLESELNIYNNRDFAIGTDIFLIPRGEKLNDAIIKNNFKSISALYGQIICSGLVIDDFSINNCQKFDSEFKISFVEKGHMVIGYNDNDDLRGAFRNFLIAQLVDIYESININSEDITDTIKEFKVVNFNDYLSDEFYAKMASKSPEITENLLDNNNKEIVKCIKDLKNLSLSPDLKKRQDDLKQSIFRKESYKVIGAKREDRVAILDETTKKIGYASLSGELEIPCKYDNATDFSESIAVVLLNGKYGAINKYDEVVIPFEYEDLFWDVNYNLFRCVKDHLYGILDRNNNFIIAPKYEWIGVFYYSMAQIVSAESHKMGFINAVGQEIVPPIYSEVTSFVNGYAKVKIDNAWIDVDVEGDLIYEEDRAFGD